MNIKFFFFISLFIFCAYTMQAQEDIKEIVEKKLESVLENFEENPDAGFLEKLIEMSNDPVNINGSGVQLLLEFNLINEKQYRSLLAYRKLVGSIQSVNEIQFLDGYNKKILNLLSPFIYVGESPSRTFKPAQFFGFGRHQLLARYNEVLQTKSGYSGINRPVDEIPENIFLGSPAKIYARYKYSNTEHFSTSFVIEKDAGETLFRKQFLPGYYSSKKQLPLIDFSSFHFSFSNLGIIKKIVFGDYHLQFGQGLTLWSNFGFGKSAESTTVKRYAGNIISGNSTIENNFFRGFAISLEKGPFEILMFYSGKNRDANVFETSEEGHIISVTSLQNTGLHRSINELNDRNVLNEKFYGARISFNSNTFQIGTTTYISKFNAELLPSDQLYKKFEFSGKMNNCLGIDYQWYFNRANFFGEFSTSRNHGIAYLSGINFYPDSFSSICLLYRNYQPEYQNLYSNSFSEGNVTKNEKGFYLGFDCSFIPKWQLKLYVDFFRFPWLKSSISAPSDGIDCLVQLNYTPSDDLIFYFRYKRKLKKANTMEESWSRQLTSESRDNIRLEANYGIGAGIQLKSRVEYVKFKNPGSNDQSGVLTFQQIAYSFPLKPISFNFRYTNFNTNGYDSRIYTYENDVLYAFSIPSFYDKGSHFYFLVKYGLAKNLTCWMKLAHTFYQDKEKNGSGNDEINGPSKTEIKFQLSLKF